MDTNGCSTGFSLSCFGKKHTITSCFLCSNHIPSPVGRWGGLNQPPAGFRDAPTQENQATALARLQTAAANTGPGLKAGCLLLRHTQRGRLFYSLDFLCHCWPLPDGWSLGAKNFPLKSIGISIHVAGTELGANEPVSPFTSRPALFLRQRQSQRKEGSHIRLSSQTFSPSVSLISSLTKRVYLCQLLYLTILQFIDQSHQTGPVHSRCRVHQFSVCQDLIGLSQHQFFFYHWSNRHVLLFFLNFPMLMIFTTPLFTLVYNKQISLL